jgi:hypothetical protein
LHSASGEILRYWDSELISRAKLFRERTGAEIGGEIAHKRRGAADCGEYREAAYR